MSEAVKPSERRKNAAACRQCGRGLPPGRKGRRYCGAGCRFKAWRAAHGVAAEACAYCGVRADTKDHVPAVSVRPFLAETLPGRYPELEVPCCRECNSALGARGLTIAARRELARVAIEKRYRDVLKAPAWTSEELAEMGPGMTSVIKHDTELKAWVRARLSWTR